MRIWQLHQFVNLSLWAFLGTGSMAWIVYQFLGWRPNSSSQFTTSWQDGSGSCVGTVLKHFKLLQGCTLARSFLHRETGYILQLSTIFLSQMPAFPWVENHMLGVLEEEWIVVESRIWWRWHLLVSWSACCWFWHAGHVRFHKLLHFPVCCSFTTLYELQGFSPLWSQMMLPWGSASCYLDYVWLCTHPLTGIQSCFGLGRETNIHADADMHSFVLSHTFLGVLKPTPIPSAGFTPRKVIPWERLLFFPFSQASPSASSSSRRRDGGVLQVRHNRKRQSYQEL